MNLELRAQIRQLAAKGLGHEDICVLLKIRGRDCREIRNIVLGKSWGEQTLFHVKHLQPRRLPWPPRKQKARQRPLRTAEPSTSRMAFAKNRQSFASE